jgi:hypothetical protein
VIVVFGILLPQHVPPFVPVALPVALGVALLILAGERGAPIANRLLQLPPLRFVGLISYSLYLWHWPVIVFAQYYLVRDLSFPESIAVFGLMMTGAICSWRYVEHPFREASMSIRTVHYPVIGGVLSVAVLAVIVLCWNGFPGCLSAQAAVIAQAVGTNSRCSLSDYVALGTSRACLMNPPSRKPTDADVVLIGNSPAHMIAPVWASMLAARVQTELLVPANGCLPMLQANISQGCIFAARRILMEVESLSRAKTVIVGLN